MRKTTLISIPITLFVFMYASIVVAEQTKTVKKTQKAQPVYAPLVVPEMQRAPASLSVQQPPDVQSPKSALESAFVRDGSGPAGATSSPGRAVVSPLSAGN